VTVLAGSGSAPWAMMRGVIMTIVSLLTPLSSVPENSRPSIGTPVRR
jgi:hypothetical protein